MPILTGELPRAPGPMAPCRWCGAPTDLSFAPPGSRIGPVPLHMLCGAAFILAYERMQAGLTLKIADRRRLDAFLAPQLGDGHAADSSAIALQRGQPIR
jgi:hypothetical protein